MKSMKKKIIVVAAMTLAIIGSGLSASIAATRQASVNTLQGQQYQPMSAEDRAKSETAWMKTDLSLTDQQVVKVDTINLKYAKMREGMRGQFQQGDRDAMRAKMLEMQNQKNAELKTVLTEDQMKKYLEVLPQHRGNGGQGRGPMGGQS